MAVKAYIITFTDKSEREVDAVTQVLTKRSVGVEVVTRNEEELEYEVNLYPWHEISEVTTFGVLERKGKNVRSS